MAETTLKTIMNYFGMSSSEFAREWKQLSQADKDDIKQGITNGSLTY